MVSAALREAFIQPDRAAASRFGTSSPTNSGRSGRKLRAHRRQRARHAAAHGLPSQHRTKLDSTNPLEPPNKEAEVKRRADVVGIFPNGSAPHRARRRGVAGASYEWQLQHRYIQNDAIVELTTPLLDAHASSISTAAA
jgi:putative transposase